MLLAHAIVGNRKERGSNGGSPKDGKSPGRGSPKPRMVYFTVNEYNTYCGNSEDMTVEQETDQTVFMAYQPPKELTADEMLDQAIAQARAEQLARDSFPGLPAIPDDMDFEEEDWAVMPFNAFPHQSAGAMPATPMEMPGGGLGSIDEFGAITVEPNAIAGHRCAGSSEVDFAHHRHRPGDEQ